MLLERIYWEDGLLLDSDILDRSNLAILESSAFSNYLPFNLNRGIITFDIDTESLNSGLILVKDLKLYLQDKKLFSSIKNIRYLCKFLLIKFPKKFLYF